MGALKPTARGEKHLPVGSFTRKRFSADGPRKVPPNTLSLSAASNVLVILNAMTGENGGTRLVLGSHLAGCDPDKVMDAKVNTISAEGPFGCAIITDGRYWHGTGSNQNKTDLNVILATFCDSQFRPQENYMVGIRPEVFAKASDQLRELNGFRV
tara:strand:+ start:1623 stop:2087 length:465 start_codon:yes stop_codon:yes gene_type:complete